MLRWENLEAAPQWLEGIPPRHLPAKGVHTVRLAPNEATVFRVPRRSMIRVVHPFGPLDRDDIEIWISDGAGLYRRQLSGQSIGNTSLLLVPDETAPMIARVTRPATAKCPIEIAIFTSRYLDSDYTAWPCCEILGCGEPLSLADKYHQTAARYFAVAAQGTVTARITGPVRLVFDSRRRFGESEAETFQAYSFQVRLDDQLPHQLEYETVADYTTDLLLDGTPAVFGNRRSSVMEIPSGVHQLQITSTAEVLLRLGIVAPRHPVDALALSQWPSIWHDSVLSELPQVAQDPLAALADRASLAVRVARDNAFRQGGIRGYWLMRTAASSHWNVQHAREIAEQIRDRNTHYRNLLPTMKSGSGAQFPAWLTTRRLRDFGEATVDTRLSAYQLEESLVGLSLAHFTHVGDSAATANLYHLPPHLGRSLLRVIVDQGQLRAATRIMVQFDGEPPIELEAHCQTLVPRAEFVPSRAEAALAAIDDHAHATPAGTLGGIFAQQHEPLKLATTATNEFDLPAGTSQVRVWAHEPFRSNLQLALQYRTSSPYRLTEAAYYQALTQIEDPFALFLEQCQARRRGVDDSLDVARAELHNHWQPAVRQLLALAASFDDNSAISPPPYEDAAAATPPRPGPDWQDSQEKAARLAGGGQLVAAIELWSGMLNRAAADERRDILRKRVEALLQLGEFHLAEAELCGWLKSATAEPALRAWAFDRILELYVQWQDFPRLQQLLAAEALRTASPGAFAALSHALADDGDYEAALTVALALPAAEQPHDIIARCAYQLRWWQTLRRSAERLPAEQRNYWIAQEALATGRPADSEAFLAKAGDLGRQTLRHLQRGRSIAHRLQASHLATRAEALFDFETWQAEHPGARHWELDSTLTSRFAGAESIYFAEHDNFGLYYRGGSDTPVQLRVLGPLRLRLETRVLRDASHPASPAARNDGWLQLRLDDQTSLHRLDTTSTGYIAQLLRAPNVEISRANFVELDVGPGLHQIDLAAENFDSLVRVYVERPECPLPILPRLTSDVLDAILAGTWGRKVNNPQLPVPDSIIHVIAKEAAGSQQVQMWRQARLADCSVVSHRAVLGELLAGRLALRRDEPVADFSDLLTQWALATHEASWSERLLALARCGELHRHYRTFCQTDSPLAAAVQQALALHHQDFDSVRSIAERGPDLGDGPSAAPGDRGEAPSAPSTPGPAPSLAARYAAEYLAICLHQATHLAAGDSPQAARWFVAAQQFAHREAARRELYGLRLSLDRMARWRIATEIESSAGVHATSVQGWTPEAMSARVRKSLLPIGTDDNVLTGQSKFVMGLQRATAVQLELRLTQLQASFAPIDPMTVLATTGQGQLLAQISLRPGEAPRVVQLDLPDGTRRVELSIAEPQPNQYVMVDANAMQVADDAAPPLAPVTLPLVRETSRLYHVATRSEPVRVRLAAPAWVRIDQLHKSITTSRYLAVIDPAEPLVLAPNDDQPVLFRVFVSEYTATEDPLAEHTAAAAVRHRAPRAGDAPQPDGLYELPVLSAPESFEPPTPGGMDDSPGVPNRLPLPDVDRSPAAQIEFPAQPSRRWLPETPADSRTSPWPVLAVSFQEPIRLPDPIAPIDRLPGPTSVADSLDPDELDQLWSAPDLANITNDDPLTRLALLPSYAFAENLRMNDLFRLGGQEDGTWALGVSAVQRRPVEEQPGLVAADRFMQWSATHRKYDEWSRCFHQTDLMLRTRDQGGSTFGGSYEFWNQRSRRPVTINGNLYGFLQDPGQPISPDESAATQGSVGGQLKLLTRRVLPLGSCSYHTPSLTLFGRYLSLDENIYPPGQVDQDIFTPFKNDHRFGLRLADTFTFPGGHDDRYWWIRPAIGSNENFDLLAPDHGSLQLGRSQWFGFAGVECSYRYTRYNNDADRGQAVSQHILYLDTVAEYWNASGQRWELAGALRYDVLDHDTTVSLMLVRYFDRGRLYRDIHPSQSMFLRPRHERALQALTERFWSHD